ncbi:helix-turn-helix domain-containing protein [Niabella aquatica]
MEIEVLTKEDLKAFEANLISAIELMLIKHLSSINERPEGYKTSDVRKMLGCSTNKLVSLRISRNLRTKKVGGTLYYNKDDIKKLLEEGF